MAEPVGPKFVPKAVLTAGRLAHQPFEIPTELTKSALLQGGVTHAAVGDLNKTVAKAVMDLKPRGPFAKLFEGMFKKVDDSLVGSAGKAQTATEVFWVPFSNGSHQIGHAVSNPFALFYAKRAGFEIPDDAAAAQQLLASITDPNPDSTKFPGFNWPKPAPPAEEPPAGEKPPAEEPPAGEKPPAEEPPAGEKPPAEEPPAGEKPPAEGETPPTEGGETPPPAEGGETPPPAEGGGETPPPAEGGGDPAAAGGGDVVATDQGPATNTGVASDAVGSPVPEGARAAVPVDVPVDVDVPAGATAGAAAGAEAIAPAGDVAPATGPAPTPVVDEPAPAAPVAPPA